MTMPILPFMGPLEQLGTPPGAEATVAGLPFASLLGNALGAAPAGTPLQLPAVLAQLLGRTASRAPGSPMPERAQDTALTPEATVALEQLGPEQLQLLIDALIADRSSTAPGRTDLPLTTDPDHAPKDTSAIPADTRQALLEALTARFPHVMERYGRRGDGSKETPQDGSHTTSADAIMALGVAAVGNVSMTAGDAPGAMAPTGVVMDPSITGRVADLARTLRTAFPNVDPTAIRRELSSLRPEFRDRLEQLIDRMQREFGYTVEVVETVRTQTRQDALFAQGRTAPGPVVTWTRMSPHQEGRAADVTIDGGYDNSEAFARLARVAKEVGLRTLWPRDPGHVEISASQAALGEPLAQAPALKVPVAAAPEVTAAARGPLQAATRAGIQRLPTPQPSAVLPLPTLPTDPTVLRDVRRPVVPALPDVATERPARPSAPMAVPKVASVAQVAAVAAVAQPARVANVATVATVGAAPPVRNESRVSAPASRLTAPAEAAAATAMGSTTVESKAPAAPPAMDGLVDRVIAAVNDHLARDERRGGRQDERGAERDLVAAVRERVEAAGSREAGRAVDTLVGRAEGSSGVDAPTPVSMTDRVARAMEIRDAAAERPLSSVLLRLDHPEGGEDRIRIDLRGHSVSTVMDVRDPVAADRLATHAPELSRALEQRGLEPEAVTIRAIRPDSSLTGAASVTTERDGGRVTSSSTASDSNSTGQDRNPRDPNRAYDHQAGDGRQRHRRDSKGSR